MYFFYFRCTVLNISNLIQFCSSCYHLCFSEYCYSDSAGFYVQYRKSVFRGDMNGKKLSISYTFCESANIKTRNSSHHLSHYLPLPLFYPPPIIPLAHLSPPFPFLIARATSHHLRDRRRFQLSPHFLSLFLRHNTRR